MNESESHFISRMHAVDTSLFLIRSSVCPVTNNRASTAKLETREFLSNHCLKSLY